MMMDTIDGRGPYLLVLEAQEQNFFHHGQLGLFATLSAFADISGVEGNLVPIFAVLVARLGGRVFDVGG